ncbi:MAG: aldo/keto reductase [Alphaproteobacteria bacterium]
MEKRALGKSGLSIAPIMFGCNVFGPTLDEAGGKKILDAFVDAGFNGLDTADVYGTFTGGPPSSELTLGAWFKSSGKRDKVVLATKVGFLKGRLGLKAANIVAACEDSLKRLQTDRIDLYQSHRDDPEAPQEETMEAFDKLIKAGKVRAIGASNFSAERLQSAEAISKAKGFARYETLQPHYNLMVRDQFEGALQDYCVREKVGVITYFSLASGFLTGKYRSEADKSKSKARGGAVAKYMTDHGWGVLKAMDAVATRQNVKLSQIALAWLLAKPGVTAPIASATTIEQLDELLAATRVKLTAQDIAELDAASAPKAAAA